jgi:hypothetical protein
MAAARGEEERTHPGAARAWAVWWVLLAALYLALVDTIKVPELVAGAVIAAIGATAAVLVRRQRRVLIRPRAVWLLAAGPALAGTVRDLVPLAVALWRRGILRRPEEGRLHAVPYDAVGHDPTAAAHRVLTEVIGSVAPNTIVVGVDAERHELIAHQLVETDDPGRAARPLGRG